MTATESDYEKRLIDHLRKQNAQRRQERLHNDVDDIMTIPEAMQTVGQALFRDWAWPVSDEDEVALEQNDPTAIVRENRRQSQLRRVERWLSMRGMIKVSGRYRYVSRSQLTSDLGTIAKKRGSKQDFQAWMEAERRVHGTFPPVENRKGARDGSREWGAKNKVDRSTIARWVKELGFSRNRGHPKSGHRKTAEK